jgi:uncharacterized membrane protein YphA (DoxX/SURF4 family)
MACWHKIVDPAAFALDIATYQILPIELVNLMAIVLPWLELTAALMLLVGFRARAASLLMTGMMLMFTLAVSLALARGLDMSCGCFASQGINEDPVSWRTILRDATWLALSVYVLLFDHAPLGVDRWLGRRAAGASRVVGRRSSL